MCGYRLSMQAVLILYAIIFFGCANGPINILTDLELNNGLYYKKNKNKPFTGKIFSNFNNQMQKTSGYLLDGKRDGLWIEHYENGRIKIKASFKNGMAHGIRQEWYDNGVKKQQGDFKNDEYDGRWLKWHPSGSYLSSNDQRIVFGLGKEEKVKMVEIFWAGGIEKEIFNNLDSNYYYKISEGVSISTITY